MESEAFRAWTLADIPARVRFLSCEPLIDRLTLFDVTGETILPRIHWVIVGGESGPNARVMDIAWARALQRECTLSGVAFFLKQLGGFPDKRGHEKALLDGKRYTEMPVLSSPTNLKEHAENE